MLQVGGKKIPPGYLSFYAS